MVAKYPWAKALQVSDKQISTWSSGISSKKSLLIWCFENRKINETIYLSWAKNFYGLPVLGSDYFEQSANHQFFEKIRTVSAWSENLIPVREWDGVVFVACLEPPTEIKWSFPVQFLLAPYSGLQAHWQQLSGEQEVMNEADLPPTPTTLRPEAGSSNTDSAIESFATEDSPEGLDFDTRIMEPPDLSNSSRSDEFPEGMDFGKGDSQPGVSTEAMEISSASLESNEAPEGLEGFESSSVRFSKEITDDGSESIVEIAEPSQPIAAPLTSISRPDRSTPQPNSKATVDNNEESETTGKALSISQAPNAFSMARSDDEAAAFVFAQLKTAFPFAVILKMQGHQLHIWRWLEGMKISDTTIPLDLSIPSLFRIVIKTKNPYHGPVVSNPVNDTFFKILGLKQNPAHVTAQPIVAGQNINGILIAFGDTIPNSESVLTLTRKLADQLASRISSSNSVAA